METLKAFIKHGRFEEEEKINKKKLAAIHSLTAF